MRILYIYLIGYALLVGGALAALWASGVLERLPAAWVIGGALVALGLGVLLALVSRLRPRAAQRG